MHFIKKGSFLMRSSGCIINDIVDKELDAKVERTKNRPLVTKVIKEKQVYLIFLIITKIIISIKLLRHIQIIIKRHMCFYLVT